jgi:hypothetical protein
VHCHDADRKRRSQIVIDFELSDRDQRLAMATEPPSGALAVWHVAMRPLLASKT